MFITYKLNKTLREVGITRNALAVESKVRPNTIADIANGNTKSVNIKTLMRILTTINEIAEERGLEPNFGIEDVFLFEYKVDFSEIDGLDDTVVEEDLGLSRDKSTFLKRVEKAKLSDFVERDKNVSIEDHENTVRENRNNHVHGNGHKNAARTSKQLKEGLKEYREYKSNDTNDKYNND